MNQTETKRSGMLSAIYDMLPGIDNDYAAKLVYTLEDKKTIPQLQQDIADLAAQLSSDSPMTDTTIAKMLLDECTLAAALRQLHIYNNSTSINELCAALNISAQDTGKLLGVYASFSSSEHFDEAFEEALTQVQTENLSEEQQARNSLALLLKKADEIYARSKEIVAQNRTNLFLLADKYHLPVKLTAELELLYSQPASLPVKESFEQLFGQLIKYNPNAQLCASLTARTLLLQITPKDAQDIALASKLLNDELLEEDLMVIACRYLKVKTPQDIAAAFDAVLKRLPYVDNPEENLGLAVRVLLDGTPASFERASHTATLKRETELLRRNLSKNSLYSGFECELAHRFGGKKSFTQIERELAELLNSLPHCQNIDENKELACKVLLGMISQEEAIEQATYMQGIKAVSITQGLAPQLLKMYLGTKSANELITFFNKALAPYHFWKADREKHIFALRSLVEELNGNYNRQICQFLLDMLENGSSVQILTDMLPTIQQKKDAAQELDTLLWHYKQAHAEAKSIQKEL